MPWIAVGGGGTESPLTTKGDLYTFDSDNARLPVGDDGHVLTADSGEATGLKWAPAAGGSGSGSYSETIGDNSNSSYQVEHGLGTEDIVVQLWDLTGSDPVEATGDASSITIDDDDTITVAFSAPPAVDSYRVVVLSDGGTGGGGGGGTVTPIEPDAITDLEVWVAADEIVGLSDNDSVATWSDLSGNAAHFTQATSGAQPTYQTNEINSLPVVRFDDNDGMEGGPSLANPFSIFYVCRTTATTGNRRAIQGNSNNWLLGPYSGSWQWYSGAFATTLGSIVSGEVVVHGVVQTASTGWHFLWRGGVVDVYPVTSGEVSFQSRATPGAVGQLALGSAGAHNEGLNGDLAEIVAYSRALTHDEGAGLMAYLVDKWGL